MSFRPRFSARVLGAAAFCLGLAALPAAFGEARPVAQAPIIAFGDVHGDADALRALLRSAGIVDDDERWIAGATQLVSLGDLLDRGPDSRAVMDLLMRLQREAPAAGGAVHVVLGNHEQMNLTGDLRYVAEAEYAAFDGPEDEALRAAALERARALDLDAATVRERPPGFFAHRAAFAADGDYARWLLAQPAVLKLGSTLFLHGGLSPLLADIGLEAANARVDVGLRTLVEAAADPAYDRPDRRSIDLLSLGAQPADADAELAALAQRLAPVATDPVFGADGPLWYRGNATCPAPLEAGPLAASLERLGVERVVIGHTPQRDGRIRSRLGGRIILADTGMLSAYYGGRPRALVIEGDALSVRSPAADQDAPEPLAAAVDAGRSPEAVEVLLRDGILEAVDGDRATLSHAQHGTLDVRVLRIGERARARLRAARALDQLLGLGMVPAVAERELAGRSVLLEVDDGRWLSEAARQERGIGVGSSCHAGHPYDLVRLFDALAANARSAADFDYRLPDLALRLRGHEDAFGRGRRVPALTGPPDVLRGVLENLSEEAIIAALEPMLGARSARAVAVRRDALLEGLGGS